MIIQYIVTEQFRMRCEKGLQLLHFIFIKLTILYHKKEFFLIKV
jgi:hypothetical protein